MLTGVLLGIFIIPVLFVIFQYLHERLAGKQDPEELDETLEEDVELINA
jgi:HAE1 family hydrophobic/amphiphilic exporter-1